MARHAFPATCHRCGKAGLKNDYAWAAHADFCWPCMTALVEGGLATPDRGPTFNLTEAGEAAMPELAVVTVCPLDGSPIYRRWVDSGAADAGESPACPFCLGRSHLIT